MLVLFFLFLVLVIFVAVTTATRPTPDERAMEKRILALSASTGEAGQNPQDFDQLLKAAVEGNFGWLEEAMRKFRFTAKLQLLLMQADAKTTIGALVAWSAGLGLLSALLMLLFFQSAIFAALAGCAAGLIPFLLLSLRKNRRIAAFNAALPDVVDMMARSLRAGNSVVAAIGMVANHAVAPAGAEFGEVYRKQNFGLPMRDALLQLQERVPSTDLRVVITGMLVQKDTGGNLAEILDRTAFVIRERIRIHGEIRTHTAQGRMTGWILCALPIVMLVLINIINPGYSHVLFYDSFGRKLLFTGIALLCVGGMVIRKIINGIEV